MPKPSFLFERTSLQPFHGGDVPWWWCDLFWRRHEVSCGVRWSNVLGCEVRVAMCHVMWCDVVPCHVKSFDVMWLFVSCLVTSCDVIFCTVLMSCGVMPDDVRMWWVASANIETIRQQSDYDPRIKSSSLTRRFGGLTRPILEAHFVCKIHHLALRLSLKISRNGAPARKSDAPTLLYFSLLDSSLLFSTLTLLYYSLLYSTLL